MVEFNYTDIKEKITTMVSEPTFQYGYVCSPMNYIGGKYKLLSQILPLFPKKIKTFVDLFCGGCNVGINAQAQKVVFNDNLSYLIDLYKSFNTLNSSDVLSHIQSRITQYDLSQTNEKGYKELRKLYNTERNPLDLFVLVAYSFNHQIRFNNSHEFNNPFGRERSSFNPRIKKNLVNFLDKLHKRSSEFVCSNFDNFDFSSYTNEDFIYCDPPYLITTGTYNDGKRGFTGWNNTEETKLLNILSELNKKNIRFGLSNVMTHKGKKNELLIEWTNSNNFFVVHLNKSYSNSNYQSKNKDSQGTDEVLITNYQPIHKYSLFNNQANEIYRK